LISFQDGGSCRKLAAQYEQVVARIIAISTEWWRGQDIKAAERLTVWESNVFSANPKDAVGRGVFMLYSSKRREGRCCLTGT
jgi:hypothetical protein